ncbi:MAG: ECF transporter S component [Vulcanimicrobiota bacterium]
MTISSERGRKTSQSMSLREIALCALLISLVAIITLIVRIPTPVTGGYVNLGDVIIIAGSFLLGSVRGFLIGGFGSAVADIIGGHVWFAPGTLLIKGLEGYLAGFVGKDLNKRNRPVLMALGGFMGAVVMIAGYFVYELFLRGYAVALTAVIPNTFQGLVGICGAFMVYPLLRKARRDK